MEPESALLQAQRGAAELDASTKKEQVRRDVYIAAHPNLSEEIKNSIHAGSYAIGMTEDDALVCMTELKGKLLKVNRDTDAHGFRDQGVLYNGGYLYFDNGILESIQSSGGSF